MLVISAHICRHLSDLSRMMEGKALHLLTPCWFSWLGGSSADFISLMCSSPVWPCRGTRCSSPSGRKSVGVVRVQGDGTHLQRTGGQSSAALTTRPQLLVHGAQGVKPVCSWRAGVVLPAWLTLLTSWRQWGMPGQIRRGYCGYVTAYPGCISVMWQSCPYCTHVVQREGNLVVTSRESLPQEPLTVIAWIGLGTQTHRHAHTNIHVHSCQLTVMCITCRFSVARLQLTGNEETAETADFVAYFNKFFDCLNVSSLSVGKLKSNVFKSPYRSAEDFRLKVRTIRR